MMATTKEVTMMMTMMIPMILAMMTVIAVKMVVMIRVMLAVKMKTMSTSAALREMRSQKNKNCHRKAINVAIRDK